MTILADVQEKREILPKAGTTVLGCTKLPHNLNSFLLMTGVQMGKFLGQAGLSDSSHKLCGPITIILCTGYVIQLVTTISSF
jgi:hypothetical protein